MPCSRYYIVCQIKLKIGVSHDVIDLMGELVDLAIMVAMALISLYRNRSILNTTTKMSAKKVHYCLPVSLRVARIPACRAVAVALDFGLSQAKIVAIGNGINMANIL